VIECERSARMIAWPTVVTAAATVAASSVAVFAGFDKTVDHTD
jgi:hypothetical protein